MIVSCRFWRLAACSLALLAFAAGGCGDAGGDSCTVETGEMSVVATVVDSGSTLRAEIDFERGDRSELDDPLTLCDDDELTINGERPTKTERPGRVVYGVSFDGDAERTVAFDLDRQGGEERVRFEVTLPPIFEILAPADGDAVSRGADLVMQWEPPAPDDTMRIELREEIGMGVCIFTDEGEHHYKRLGGVDVPDDGDWMIPADSVHSDLDEACSASYLMSRIVAGDYPAALGQGGYVEARVDRTVTFDSVP